MEHKRPPKQQKAGEQEVKREGAAATAVQTGVLCRSRAKVAVPGVQVALMGQVLNEIRRQVFALTCEEDSGQGPVPERLSPRHHPQSAVGKDKGKDTSILFPPLGSQPGRRSSTAPPAPPAQTQTDRGLQTRSKKAIAEQHPTAMATGTQQAYLFRDARKFGQWPTARKGRMARLRHLLSRMTRRSLEMDLLKLLENHHYLCERAVMAEVYHRRSGRPFEEQREKLLAAEREVQELRRQLEELRARQQQQQQAAQVMESFTRKHGRPARLIYSRPCFHHPPNFAMSGYWPPNFPPPPQLLPSPSPQHYQHPVRDRLQQVRQQVRAELQNPQRRVCRHRCLRFIS
ncbi:unnamed protein product [Vitrella brassicaformis CCMP3155]|uniref:Uncharacterized protein n=1 Tax=Vitrella brassicaformis (strain CCMP3155) TaxID=1169540 RepID=A0A0G4GDY7_VITBC|nr:unnamed protein product [Vitrella brassicaformis CCMP3155]|eukprot:CEM27644.1 unnamed protein product [Vitrella brassicaformis CCMP3155]